MPNGILIMPSGTPLFNQLYHIKYYFTMLFVIFFKRYYILFKDIHKWISYILKNDGYIIIYNMDLLKMF